MAPSASHCCSYTNLTAAMTGTRGQFFFHGEGSEAAVAYAWVPAISSLAPRAIRRSDQVRACSRSTDVPVSRGAREPMSDVFQAWWTRFTGLGRVPRSRASRPDGVNRVSGEVFLPQVVVECSAVAIASRRARAESRTHGSWSTPCK